MHVSNSVGWTGFVNLPVEEVGSFLEGAFAPLAFLWLVVGYFLQQQELIQNTQAMRASKRDSPNRRAGDHSIGKTGGQRDVRATGSNPAPC